MPFFTVGAIAVEEAIAIAAAEAAAAAAAEAATVAAAEAAAVAAAEGATAAAAEAAATTAAAEAASTVGTAAAAEAGAGATSSAIGEGAAQGIVEAAPELLAEAAPELGGAGASGIAEAAPQAAQELAVQGAEAAQAAATDIAQGTAQMPAGIEQVATPQPAGVEAVAPPEPAGLEQIQPAGIEPVQPAQSPTDQLAQELQSQITQAGQQPLQPSPYEPTASTQGTTDVGGQGLVEKTGGQMAPTEPTPQAPSDMGGQSVAEQTGGKMGNGTEIAPKEAAGSNPFMQGVDKAMKYLPLAMAGAGIVNAMAGGNNQQTMPTQSYTGPLNKYKLSGDFKGSQATPQVYKPTYAAQGGIMDAGPVERMTQNSIGQNRMYPQGQQDATQFATPTQMPTSAEVVRSSYEPSVNSYTGEPVSMARGGRAGKDLEAQFERYYEMQFGQGVNPESHDPEYVGKAGIFYDNDPDTRSKDALSAAMIRQKKNAQRTNMPTEPFGISPQPLGSIKVGPASAKDKKSASSDDDDFAEGGIAQIKSYGIGGEIASYMEKASPGGFVGDTQDKMYSLAHPGGWLGEKAEEIAPGGTLGMIHDAAPGRAEYVKRKKAGMPQKSFAEGGFTSGMTGGFTPNKSSQPINAAPRQTVRYETTTDESGATSQYPVVDTYYPSQSSLAASFKAQPDVAPNAYKPSYESYGAGITGINPERRMAAERFAGAMPTRSGRSLEERFGGAMPAMAAGGSAYDLGSYAHGGNPRLLKGPGDGMSDNIPATIGGKQPARLADGEFVFPADVVSALGNGSTEAGARELHAMMDRIRNSAHGKKTQQRKINPKKALGK